MANIKSKLPSSDSASLILTHPTLEEKQNTWKLNGQVWRGTTDISTYLRREDHLEHQAFTRDGGITFWILVDSALRPNHRPILASCESWRKRALVAKGKDAVKDIVSHGIGSVFCNPQYRAQGYAQRMITELGQKLDDWQQQEGERATFTVLYSDIGKTFYARLGWHAFPSSHIALPPNSLQGDTSEARYLQASDLSELCGLDEKWLRRESEPRKRTESNILVSLIPDIETIQWHHAREEFACREVLGRDPIFKGAYAKTEAGDRVWCIWTRTFGDNKAGNTLNILRIVIEGDQIIRWDQNEFTSRGTVKQENIRAGAAVLRAAQLEAARWNMNNVQIWNPTPQTVLAAQEIEPTSHIAHRNEESIASLRWHGEELQDQTIVEWIGNEKYGWC